MALPAMSVRNYFMTMGTLDQCVDVLGLSSFDWGKARIAVVAHSFRVMAKARNYDEMVVGIMHHVYASSSSARSLFSCDVDDIYNWKKTLDLFVEKQNKLKVNDPDNMPDEVLLDLNMDQSLKTDSARLEEWMAEECRWSSKYRRKLERIGANRTARNVMIYDLEDNLEMLIHPEKFREEESWTMVLPWKNEYGVGVSTGRHSTFHMRIPDTDDNILLRPLKNSERAGLVDKYSRAISLLMSMECCDAPRKGDYPEEKLIRIPKICMEWYDEWLDGEMTLKEMCEESDDEE